MRPRVPLALAALAALFVPRAASAEFAWDQPSSGWDVVTFHDVNGETLTYWHNDGVADALYILEPLSDGKFQAKLTPYVWKSGPPDEQDVTMPIGDSPAAPIIHVKGVVTRPDTLYQAPAEEHLPERDLRWNWYLFGGPSKTVLRPQKVDIPPTPFPLLKAAVALTPEQKASAAKNGLEIPPADKCWDGGISPKSLAPCFTPLELALGDGKTEADSEGQKISVLPAADDPVVNALRVGDPVKIAAYIDVERRALAGVESGLIKMLEANASSSPQAFAEGEDRLVLVMVKSLGAAEEKAFYTQLREQAAAHTLPQFVSTWRGKLLATLKKHAPAAGHPAPIARVAPAGASAHPKAAPRRGPAPAAAPPVAEQEGVPTSADQIDAMRRRWGK